jgi:hypothetical protein
MPSKSSFNPESFVVGTFAFGSSTEGGEYIIVLRSARSVDRRSDRCETSTDMTSGKDRGH